MPRWFRAKTFGWGWYPCTWQGWAVILGFVGLDYLNYIHLVRSGLSEHDFSVRFVLETFLLVAILFVICGFTGERLGWHWNGKPVAKKTSLILSIVTTVLLLGFAGVAIAALLLKTS